MSLTVFGQWAGSGSTNGDLYRNGNVGIGYAGAPPAPGLVAALDVRGDNIFLAPDGTTGFTNKFIGLGESGGDCNIYGLRVQRNSNNFINVGIKQPTGLIKKSDDIKFNPTISWGTVGTGLVPCTIFDPPPCIGQLPRPLNIEYDNNATGCGVKVAAFNSPTSFVQFEVVGQALINGSLVSSDRRYKTNIRAIASPLDKVLALRGVKYGFNRSEFAEKNFRTGEIYGFIAQEIKEVLPEVVQADLEGYYAVNYDAVIPVLVGAIQEQNAELVAQSVENTTLREALADLKQQLSEIRTALGLENSSKGTGASGAELSRGAELYVNTPNPFDQVTTIGFYLPDAVQSAQLVVTGLNGETLLTRELTVRGQGSVEIAAAELAAGLYYYGLLVDGSRVATKKMILSK